MNRIPALVFLLFFVATAAQAQVRATCSARCNDGTTCSTGTDTLMKGDQPAGASVRYVLDEGRGRVEYDFAFEKGAPVDYDRVHDFVMLSYFQPELAGRLGEQVNLLGDSKAEGVMVRCGCQENVARQATCMP